jgi:GNAT superfamily N-acetyltransferase
VSGFASFTWTYSIWLGVEYLNVDDVFVVATQRGLGLGQALMNELRRVCLERGCHRLRWEVESDNAAALRFYERLGARIRAKGICTWEV